MEELRKNPHGTSMNGYTKNAPVHLNDDEFEKRMKTLRERKTLDQQRKRKTQRIKKKPLPVDQMEEFLGIKSVDPSQQREWNLDKEEFLRIQSASRHLNRTSDRHSANNVRKASLPVSQFRIQNNEESFYKRFMKNMPKGPAPRFTGRYESVAEPKPRPKPVRSGPRSQGRYESVAEPKPRPKPVRTGTQKKK